MYHAKKVIPVIIGASGTISNTLTITAKKDIKKLQKKSHTGHFIHTTSRTDVKIQNVYQMCH
jgi:hypothetical protein